MLFHCGVVNTPLFAVLIIVYVSLHHSEALINPYRKYLGTKHNNTHYSYTHNGYLIILTHLVLSANQVLYFADFVSQQKPVAKVKGLSEPCSLQAVFTLRLFVPILNSIKTKLHHADSPWFVAFE